jgi:hypothetical protein
MSNDKQIKPSKKTEAEPFPHGFDDAEDIMDSELDRGVEGGSPDVPVKRPEVRRTASAKAVMPFRAFSDADRVLLVRECASLGVDYSERPVDGFITLKCDDYADLAAFVLGCVGRYGLNPDDVAVSVVQPD